MSGTEAANTSRALRGERMNHILVVDDERNALNGLLQLITEMLPDADVHGFTRSEDALSHARENAPEAAFLDIAMPGMDGVTLADELKKLYPFINIIFTTGFSEYAPEAFALHASGYIMKPVTREKVAEELSHLRYTESTGAKRMRVQAFGVFEVFVDNEPVAFRYQKTKELLAVLVDRRGTLVTNREIVQLLFPDDGEDERTHFSYVNNLRADLTSTLAAAGIEDCVVSRYGSVSIRTDAFECDYYTYLRDGTRPAGAPESGYMNQYGWAAGPELSKSSAKSNI